MAYINVDYYSYILNWAILNRVSCFIGSISMETGDSVGIDCWLIKIVLAHALLKRPDLVSAK